MPIFDVEISGTWMLGTDGPGAGGRSAMQLNPYIVLGSAVVGLLVGLTGAAAAR
jgi:hypothetical protein